MLSYLVVTSYMSSQQDGMMKLPTYSNHWESPSYVVLEIYSDCASILIVVKYMMALINVKKESYKLRSSAVF